MAKNYVPVFILSVRVFLICAVLIVSPTYSEIFVLRPNRKSAPALLAVLFNSFVYLTAAYKDPGYLTRCPSAYLRRDRSLEDCGAENSRIHECDDGGVDVGCTSMRRVRPRNGEGHSVVDFGRDSDEPDALTLALDSEDEAEAEALSDSSASDLSVSHFDDPSLKAITRPRELRDTEAQKTPSFLVQAEARHEREPPASSLDNHHSIEPDIAGHTAAEVSSVDSPLEPSTDPSSQIPPQQPPRSRPSGALIPRRQRRQKMKIVRPPPAPKPSEVLSYARMPPKSEIELSETNRPFDSPEESHTTLTLAFPEVCDLFSGNRNELRQCGIKLRHCKLCKMFQPLRTKHCHDCKRCVHTHDHHCVWLGTCVGERNRREFYYYLLLQAMEFSIGLVILAFALTGFSSQKDPHIWFAKAWRGREQLLALVIVCIISALCGILFISLLMMVICLWCYQSYLASCNMTSWENLSWYSITYLKGTGEDQGSPFSLGFIENFLLFLRLGKRSAQLTRDGAIAIWNSRCFTSVRGSKLYRKCAPPNRCPRRSGSLPLVGVDGEFVWRINPENADVEARGGD